MNEQERLTRNLKQAQTKHDNAFKRWMESTNPNYARQLHNTEAVLIRAKLELARTEHNTMVTA